MLLKDKEEAIQLLMTFFEQKLYSGIHGATLHPTTWGAGLTLH